ncbi:MAG: NAD(P)H-dependent oxidoreductase [Candidatus Hydrogenedentes bacterium]|nr:NAD(P)H-dependent oxidoreductase [Candidatus Hydrogenedentota bacterium]
MPAPRILAFAGSLRAESYNKRLVKIAAKGAEAAGAQVTHLDLRDYPLPVFDEDLEKAEGMPANGRKIKDLMLTHDGWLLSCPEYNSSITAVLKNTIDWASRKEEGETPLQCFAGKAVCIMSASPGALGGLRGLVVVRMLLNNISMIVLPDQVAVPQAMNAFNADGALVDTKKQADVTKLGEKLAAFLTKHKT